MNLTYPGQSDFLHPTQMHKVPGLAPQATHFSIAGNGRGGWNYYQTRTARSACSGALYLPTSSEIVRAIEDGRVIPYFVSHGGTIHGDVVIDGSLTVQEDLFINGKSEFDSPVTFNEGITVHGQSPAIIVKEGPIVCEDIKASGTLAVTKASTLSSTLDVAGQTTLTTAELTGTGLVAPALTISGGGPHLAGKLYSISVGQNAVFKRSLYADILDARRGVIRHLLGVALEINEGSAFAPLVAAISAKGDCYIEGDAYVSGSFTPAIITGAAIVGCTINNSAIGGATPSSGVFTTLDSPNIGSVTPGAGVFTTLEASHVGQTLTLDGGSILAPLGASINAAGVIFTAGEVEAASGAFGDLKAVSIRATATLEATAIGSIIPGTGVFTSIGATSAGTGVFTTLEATEIGSITPGTIDATSIGAASAGTGIFTTLEASDIGSITPGTGVFTSIGAAPGSEGTGAFTTLDASDIGSITPGTGVFTSIGAAPGSEGTGAFTTLDATEIGSITPGTIDATSIGATSAGTGVFTTLEALDIGSISPGTGVFRRLEADKNFAAGVSLTIDGGGGGAPPDLAIDAMGDVYVDGVITATNQITAAVAEVNKSLLCQALMSYHFASVHTGQSAGDVGPNPQGFALVEGTPGSGSGIHYPEIPFGATGSDLMVVNVTFTQRIPGGGVTPATAISHGDKLDPLAVPSVAYIEKVIGAGSTTILNIWYQVDAQQAIPGPALPGLWRGDAHVVVYLALP